MECQLLQVSSAWNPCLVPTIRGLFEELLRKSIGLGLATQWLENRQSKWEASLAAKRKLCFKGSGLKGVNPSSFVRKIGRAHV